MVMVATHQRMQHLRMQQQQQQQVQAGACSAGLVCPRISLTGNPTASSAEAAHDACMVSIICSGTPGAKADCFSKGGSNFALGLASTNSLWGLLVVSCLMQQHVHVIRRGLGHWSKAVTDTRHDVTTPSPIGTLVTWLLPLRQVTRVQHQRVTNVLLPLQTALLVPHGCCDNLSLVLKSRNPAQRMQFTLPACTFRTPPGSELTLLNCFCICRCMSQMQAPA
jgi:hypothetical protein